MIGMLDKFCEVLIQYANESEVLFDQFFADYFFQFLESLTSSGVRAFRHTGVFLSTKFAMAVMKLVKDMNASIIDTASQVLKALKALKNIYCSKHLGLSLANSNFGLPLKGLTSCYLQCENPRSRSS